MSQLPSVGIVSTGVANTASVVAAFRQIGFQSELVEDWRKIESTRWLVLPGVGSFGHAMHRLRKQQMIAPLRDRILSGRPTLAICLGLQLVCLSSDESPGVEGLSIVASRAKRFDFCPTAELRVSNGKNSLKNLRVPHLGWNRVRANQCELLTDGHAYFAHSYYIDQVPQDWNIATSIHGPQFVSAIEKGNVLACQFHPELSGRWGQTLLSKWLKQVEVPLC